MQDIVIIGAGIVGSFLARDLSRYHLKVTVLDRENDIANETTMANSAIIHTGYDPKDETLKAKLNVAGAKMYEAITKELGVDYQKCGAYIVACDEAEQCVLRELKQRAEKRDIKVKEVNREELLQSEPHISSNVIAALEVPDTAIIYPWQCAIALMQEAVLNGVTLTLGTAVTGITKKSEGYEIQTNNGSITSKIVINAAGCGAEKIAEMLEPSPYHITLKKGEYYVLSKQVKGFANHIIYPTPTKFGKGVLAIPTTHGNTLLGPTSEQCREFDTATSRDGLETLKQQITKTIKDVPYGEIIRSYSGIRPSGNDDDFYIQPSKYDTFIHVACIDSPGLASAPAISRYVIENYIQPMQTLTKKQHYQHRQIPIVMASLSKEEKNKLIQKQPLYGKLVCRCEAISYQEIVDAIHSPCGAKTIKGIKKRVRPGMGKCQGGFCEVEVAKILAKELHLPLHEVLYDETNSRLGQEAK